MKNSSKWGRRTKRFFSGIALVFLVVLFILLLGIFPIGWILSPTSQYFPKDKSVHETIMNVMTGVVSGGAAQESEVEPAPLMTVDILSDAAIGMYLWQHIMKGRFVSKQEGNLLYGFQKFASVNWRFKAGPAVTPDQPELQSDLSNVLLVLNGRTDEKVLRAKRWLELIPKHPNLLNVAVILLGNEQCHNEWLLWYLESAKYKLRAVFVVYDSKLVDNRRVFQWPLGVATYRGFPLIELTTNDILEDRPYLCHFMGTVYRNNSRVHLMKALESSPLMGKCFVKVRYDWPERETHQSATEYLSSLQQSTAVLSPLGMNAECYRIYEALSVGCLPVIEDQKSPGVCDAPYRLLKEHNIPGMFLSDWDELPGILEYLASLSDTEVLHQRNRIIKWYSKFLATMQQKLADVLLKNFIIV